MSKLGVVEDTLFVPMLGRIYASEYCPQILYDPKALELKKKLPSSLPEQDGQSQYTLLASAARRENGALRITLEDAQTAAQKSAMRYDREGDSHFDIASALMKALRGSDPDAAVHYLARLLGAGDMVTAIRRLLCSASEDVGLAYPQAVPIVKACVDSALQLGLPEARLPLAEAAILLATWPKSNSAYQAIAGAQADVRAGRAGDIPRELQNVHADSAGQEREQGYRYPHDYPGHWVRQQ